MAETRVTVPLWQEEPITRKHNREAFDGGEPALNEFLQGGAKTFLAIADGDNETVPGFYSLAPPGHLNTPARRRSFDADWLAMMCLAFAWPDWLSNRRMQGQGLGGQLLPAAGKRCVLAASEVGGVALVIDAPLTLMLPLTTMEAALRKAGKSVTNVISLDFWHEAVRPDAKTVGA